MTFNDIFLKIGHQVFKTDYNILDDFAFGQLPLENFILGSYSICKAYSGNLKLKELTKDHLSLDKATKNEVKCPKVLLSDHFFFILII